MIRVKINEILCRLTVILHLSWNGSAACAFPAVAEAFKKANSTLPSSAAVEQLFSSASQVLNNRICKMADDTLDKLLFLRSRLKMDIAGFQIILRSVIPIDSLYYYD